VSSAQSTFSASCGNGQYAKTLDVLGSGPSGGSAFISPDLGATATATKSGYSVSMDGTGATGTACNGSTALSTGYHAWADPVSSATGTRYFGTNTTGTIWQGTATLSSMSDTATPSSGSAIQ
jgi:hypothetical protein